jgi:hypothetical protein
MKTVLSFVAGVVVCSMMYFTLNFVLPVRGNTDAGSVSGNDTSLTKLLPDFEKIYKNALQMPFIQAESKIYDKDIAEYYRALMDKTGLAPREAQ